MQKKFFLNFFAKKVGHDHCVKLLKTLHHRYFKKMIYY